MVIYLPHNRSRKLRIYERLICRQRSFNIAEKKIIKARRIFGKFVNLNLDVGARGVENMRKRQLSLEEFSESFVVDVVEF